MLPKKVLVHLLVLLLTLPLLVALLGLGPVASAPVSFRITATPAAGQTGRIDSISTRVNVREGPGAEYPVLFFAVDHTEVVLLEANADQSWYHVRLPDGSEGWISATLIAVDPLPTPTAAPTSVVPTATFTPEPTLNVPTTYSPDVLKTAKAAFEQGFASYEAGSYADAITALNTVVELVPSYSPAYFYRGEAYNKLEEYERALDDYSFAIRLGANEAQIYAGRGNVYYTLGNYQAALDDFDRALKLDPLYAEVYNARGNVYTSIELYDQALPDYDAAIALDPDYFFAYFNRGIAYFNMGEYGQASANFDQAAALDASNPDLYAWRAFAYINSSSPDETRIQADLCEHVRLAGADVYPVVLDELEARGWSCT